MKVYIFDLYASYETATYCITANNYQEAKSYLTNLGEKVIEDKYFINIYKCFRKKSTKISKKVFNKTKHLMNDVWKKYDYDGLINKSNHLSKFPDKLVHGFYLHSVSDHQPGIIYYNCYSG